MNMIAFGNLMGAKLQIVQLYLENQIILSSLDSPLILSMQEPTVLFPKQFQLIANFYKNTLNDLKCILKPSG